MKIGEGKTSVSKIDICGHQIRGETLKGASSRERRACGVAMGSPVAFRVLKCAHALPKRIAWLKQEHEVTRGLNQLACQPASRSPWQNQPAQVLYQWN